MKLKSIVSLVFCIGVVFNLHGQILPAAFGVSNPSRPGVNPIITSGLVLHLDAGIASSYPGSGTTWFDLSGNNNGTLENGPTYSSANGGSLVFDGEDDRVSAFPTQISGTGSKTISMWIKINTTSRTGLAGIRSTANWGWGFTVNRTTIGNLTFYDPSGSHLEVAAGLTTSIWYNVSVTYDSATRIATLFLNGYQIGSFSNFTPLNASTFKGVIGNEDEWTNPFGHPFKGNIAQVAIYSRAISAAEVLENYNALRPRFSDVTNPSTGRIWMDRNLGATQVATSSTDAAAYGDLYQWGRGADGHQLRTSSTTSTQSSTDVPGNADYILNNISPYDWRSTKNDNLWQGVNGVNNPCPSGYRLPTIAEWSAERGTWSSDNEAGAFASPLKLTMAGVRQFSSNSISTGKGVYWSSSVSGNNSTYIEFVTGFATTFSIYRTYGMSVRCIKN